MCLYTKRILNKRYLPTRKNWWTPPICTDERLRYIDIECGKCYECKRKKAREWRIRNAEQLKETPTATFFTGTLTDERIEKLSKKYNIPKEEANEIATKEVRLFLERIRRINGGKSIKHWIVTEKGHTNTRRIHIHGIFYAENGMSKYRLNKLLNDNWIAGYSYNGKYVNERTINYIAKYLTKDDLDNKDFEGKILASPGLGKKYIERAKTINRFRYKETTEEYRFRNGVLAPMPKYYRNKLYTENERELLWIYKQEKGYAFVMGEKIPVRNEEDLKDLENIKQFYRERNKDVHHDNEKLWEWNKNKRRLQGKLDYKIKAAKYKEEEQKKEIRAAIKLENDISEYSKLYGQWHNHTVYTSCSP